MVGGKIISTTQGELEKLDQTIHPLPNGTRIAQDYGWMCIVVTHE